MREKTWLYSSARVNYSDFNMRINAFEKNLNFATSVGKFHRIRQKIPNNLLEPCRVAHNQPSHRVQDLIHSQALRLRSWLNTGHGTLGWTMACGSARLLSDQITGRPTEISSDGLGIDRYQRKRATLMRHPRPVPTHDLP